MLASDINKTSTEPNTTAPKTSEKKIIGAVAEKVWDHKTQQYHGGQEWAFLQNFVEDFSVTTNGLGTPKYALQAAKDSLNNCGHYPPGNQEPAKTDLAKWMAPEELGLDWENVHSRMLLGNGASELIDLVTRISPRGYWKPGPNSVQYKEYERSAIADKRTVIPYDDPRAASLTCLVNPNNPTGTYMHIDELKAYIEKNAVDNSSIMVDESMQIWHSNKFQLDSLISQTEWIENMYRTRNISVYVMHSWTKIWSCTGIRLGSVLCPTAEQASEMKKLQVPWSVNVAGLRFLEVVTSPQEAEYLDKTWELTPKWRSSEIEKLKELELELTGASGNWGLYGEPFLSWIWIDFKDDVMADDAAEKARQAGVPIRPGKNGYKKYSCVRIAVREPSKVDILINAWKDLKSSK